MRVRNIILVGLIILAFAGIGCSVKPQFVNITRFTLQKPVNVPTVEMLGENIFDYQMGDYQLKFAPFQYEKLIIMYMNVYNSGDKEVGKAEYSFELFDGRDLLPIKRITEEELAAIHLKFNNPQGFNLTSPSLQGAMDTFNSLLSFPANSELSNKIKQIEAQIFSFRPLYPHEDRQGFIPYVHDFRLEYPLVLKVAIRDKVEWFFFYPKQVGEK